MPDTLLVPTASPPPLTPFLFFHLVVLWEADCVGPTERHVSSGFQPRVFGAVSQQLGGGDE